jgi:hypothetical protein
MAGKRKHRRGSAAWRRAAGMARQATLALCSYKYQHINNNKLWRNSIHHRKHERNDGVKQRKSRRK